jgi:hypothetical protein
VVVIFLLLQIMIWTHGCSSSTSGIGNNDQLALLGIKNTARVLGYAIGNSKATNDDEIIKGSYFLFRQGQMTEVQMTVVISQMKKMHPLAAAGALDLLAAMGGMINPDQGTVLDVSGIKPEIWDAAATAYAFGFDLGINDRQKGGRQAVIM